MKPRSFAEILLDLGLISVELLKDLKEERHDQSIQFFESKLLAKQCITEEDLIKAKEIFYQTSRVDLKELRINPECISMLPEMLARRHLLLPLEVTEDEIHIAINNPWNILALDEVKVFFGKKVVPYLATSSQILEGIEHSYRLNHSGTHQMIQQFEEEVMFLDEREEPEWAEVDQAPIIRLANHIIQQAIQNRASDIHIEPTREDTQVRYRIDGVLYVLYQFPHKVHPPLISRLKIMANLDISRHFVPQDGAISYLNGQKQIDLRMSTLPTIYGEKVVLRILNQHRQIFILEELGLLGDDIYIYRDLLKHNHGIILITGPTGSGKSTTLSASVQAIHSSEINISTVEDPVEYKLDQINQIQVNEKTGLTFALALRALLRQDPDVLMIGEIRDEETANIALRAALTGHLVLSSLHTNDAVSSIQRLTNMGVPSYLIASSLIGVVAQRLVRRICPNCCEETKISEEFENMFVSRNIILPKRILKGKGCSKCNETGYQGRIGVYEILQVDKTIREYLIKQRSLSQIYQYHFKQRKTLLQDALSKVEKGLTTIDEIIRVIL